MRKKILLTLFLLVFFTVTYLLLPNISSTPCVLYNDFLDLDINGKVVKKYIDHKQHSYPIIEIQQNELDTAMRLNFVLEKTKVFEEINKLDVLIKVKGSDSIFIIRHGGERIIKKVDFGCE